MANLELFCLVEGDPTSRTFSVNVSPDNTVQDLKDLIKAKRSPEFNDIAAGSLTLWVVALIGPDSELPIRLSILSHPVKLFPKKVLSSVFTGPPDDDTYILVQRPPAATQNDPDIASEIANLRKQLSELKSAPFTLGIIDKRRGRKVVCQYIGDTKTATLEDLRQQLQKHFDEFEGDEYFQIFVYPGVDTPASLTTDDDLRSTLELALQNGWKNLTISLDSLAKGFSKYTWKAVMEEYQVGDGPEHLKTFDIQPRAMNDEEKMILDEIVKECSRRNEAYIFGPSSSESTRNTIVDVFMVGAMQSYKADMFLAQQKHLSGRRGHGPVDFTVLDRKHQTPVLAVTAVKKDYHVQGLAKNMVQLDVAVQQKKRKRVEADDDDEERPSTRLRSFGIVTDGFKWRFVECTQVNNETPDYRTKEVLGDFRIGSGAQKMREDAETLFGYVLSLYDCMKEEIVNRTRCNSPAEPRPPSALGKRIATGKARAEG
ncbi:hypothetical protein B0O80DRAFT_24139 [Mortierella sp. GBAus27b]|nr:hypothetical protein B0O80DRAFT_24139 [Mortierella sp. GBAus27b]